MFQPDALSRLESGRNAFVTGPAGTGKTYLLREFIASAIRQGRKVAVTASTGIAATHLEGKTLHSFAGLGIRDSFSEKDIAQIAKRHYVADAIRKADVLVIDEVSMLHPATFDAADRVCKRATGNSAPFGGMQVVLCGDFFQLPPVSNTPTEFIYGSSTWDEVCPEILYLDEQYRQTDTSLFRLLTSMRYGDISDEYFDALKSRMYAELDAEVNPTRLHTHNKNVDYINAKQLATLHGRDKSYDMRLAGDEKIAESLAKGCLAPKALTLKQGAAVMFVKNGYNDGYVNGTLGTVVDFSKDGSPIVETDRGTRIVAEPQKWEFKDVEEKTLASITQIPLRLAWAITVHKSQGMSLSAAEIDLSSAFVAGLGYVALSRVTAMDGIRLLGLNAQALRVSPQAQAIDEALRSASPSQ